jgi:hypothetical protein
MPFKYTKFSFIVIPATLIATKKETVRINVNLARIHLYLLKQDPVLIVPTGFATGYASATALEALMHLRDRFSAKRRFFVV